MNRPICMAAIVVLPVLAIAGLALTYSARGTSAPLTDATAVASDVAPAPGSAALRAHLDPETGELSVGVGAVDALALDPDTQNALRRDAHGLVETRHPDGSVSVNLQGRFQSVAMVHIDENGRAVVCADDPASALRTLSGDVASSTPEVK